MHQWNEIFKNRGKVFTKIQEDIPKISEFFRKHKVKKILDIGFGSGRHVVYFAKKGFDVYGIDISEEGLKITKSLLKKSNLKARLKIGDIYKKLPYKNDFFDAAISIQTLHHGRIGKIRKLIKEMERILKPRGLIFITVSKKRPKKEIPKEKLWKIKFIAPRTFIPLSHEEKGLIHYRFNKNLLRKEFKNFKIYDIWTDSDRGHYCFLGRLKNGFSTKFGSSSNH
jgi:ubiquinone/menaquinone biosynthesis C-methylase UbiE